jgi:hypothetical protein
MAPTPLPVSTDLLTTLIAAAVERLDLFADPAQGPPWVRMNRRLRTIPELTQRLRQLLVHA